LVPQDAYPFVNALDQLIWEMATKNFEQKLQIQGLYKKYRLFLHPNWDPRA
jgi:hypothetical protein